MSSETSKTLREAVSFAYEKLGFPSDGGVTADYWSPISVRGLPVVLPNFDWRKKAVPYHDLHHILTGYPFSPTGEFEMAAWEFAAGRYPNLYTTLFCIPLVCMGALLIPKRTFNAYVRGTNSRTLYSVPDLECLLDQSVVDIRRRILPNRYIKPRLRDFLGYLGLVVCSGFVLTSPFTLILGIWLLVQ